MQFRLRSFFAISILTTTVTACGSSRTSGAPVDGSSIRSEGLVLQANEGERRVRRNAGKGPFILKVDRKNGGSPDLVMGYEELAPGAEIQPHTHLVADEILFVHRGSGVVKLGDRESTVSTGGTVYIPTTSW